MLEFFSLTQFSKPTTRTSLVAGKANLCARLRRARKKIIYTLKINVVNIYL